LSFKTLEFLTQKHVTATSFKPLFTALWAFCKPQQNGVEDWVGIAPVKCLTTMLQLYKQLKLFYPPLERSVGEVKHQPTTALADDSNGMSTASTALESKTVVASAAAVGAAVGGIDGQTDLLVQLWLFAVSRFCELCLDGRIEVREHSIEFLRKCLLTAQVSVTSPRAWHTCVQDVLVPTLLKLCELTSSTTTTNNTASSDSVATTSTTNPAQIDVQQVFVGMLFRLFLQNLDMLKTASSKDFMTFWVQFLSAMQGYFALVQHNEHQIFHLSEQIKNAVFVLHADGIFTRFPALWEATLAAVDVMLPSLKAVLIATTLALNAPPVIIGGDLIVKSPVPVMMPLSETHTQ
jgi:hypothetical protein